MFLSCISEPTDNILGIISDNSDKISVGIIPSFEFWAPWIGEKSRINDTVFNTEFKKCVPSNDDEINEPIPEELLHHLLSDEKVYIAF